MPTSDGATYVDADGGHGARNSFVRVEGNGTTRVGDDTLSWGAKDIFSLPHGNWITHRASSEKATLFVVTDRDTLRRLDLLKEQYGNR